MTEESWKTYVGGVKPIVKKKKVKLCRPEAKEEGKSVLRRHAEKAPVTMAAPVFAKPLVKETLERKREKALREGDLDLEAKLDLHGLTQRQAFEKLGDFMRKCVKEGKRTLLVVTGKGTSGQGVLRKNLETWLARLPEASSVLTLRQAVPKHGGEGAFYLLLRKKSAAKSSALDERR